MSLTLAEVLKSTSGQMLPALCGILAKGQASAAERNIPEDVFLTDRLYPDMFPLTRQVQIATDTAKGAIARLAGVEIPKYDDTEQTIAELKARIARTVDFLMSVPAAKVEGSAEKDITMKIAGKDTTLKGAQYLLGHAYPNFYFHCTTAYDLMRHCGIELGKRDFMSQPVSL